MVTRKARRCAEDFKSCCLSIVLLFELPLDSLNCKEKSTNGFFMKVTETAAKGFNASTTGPNSTRSVPLNANLATWIGHVPIGVVATMEICMLDTQRTSTSKISKLVLLLFNCTTRNASIRIGWLPSSQWCKTSLLTILGLFATSASLMT